MTNKVRRLVESSDDDDDDNTDNEYNHPPSNVSPPGQRECDWSTN